MSLLQQLRSRIGLDGGDGREVTERAARAARRTGERVRDVDGERARQATVRASRSIAAEPPGRVREPRGTPRERDVAKRAEEVAAMKGPVDATLEPADSMGIDRLARADRSRAGDTSEVAPGPRADDLATNVGAAPPDDDGLFDFSPPDGDEADEGWF